MPFAIFLWLFLSFSAAAVAQQQWKLIYFTDKKETTYQLHHPAAFLSERAIARRIKTNIPIDSTDLPVPSVYADSIARIQGVTASHRSKWLNAMLVRISDAGVLNQINRCSFVKKTTDIALRIAPRRATQEANTWPLRRYEQLPYIMEASLIQYGTAASQIQMHNGQFLHQQGWRGQNIIIAFLDAGFRGYLQNSFYDSARASGRILGVYDLVSGDGEVNNDNSHGNYVFSIVAANKPGYFVGTAPAAQYYLFRTEDVSSELPIEEFNWLVAAEMADSLGVDIISSSLGYSTFDQPIFNYQYAQMDGNTALVTRAAEMAFAKGMLVVNSAGNEGNNTWKYIVAPADGAHVLAVGAVNATGSPASFSSQGPTADGRIKPDVVATGAPAALVNSNGNLSTGTGTSFACPIISGLAACLWQAFPQATNTQLLEAIRKSSSIYLRPDFTMGYGIPDFSKAYQYLQAATLLQNNDWIKLYPNPATISTTLTWRAQADGVVSLKLLQLNGTLLYELKVPVIKNEIYVQQLTLPPSSGMYLLLYQDGNHKATLRIIKP